LSLSFLLQFAIYFTGSAFRYISTLGKIKFSIRSTCLFNLLVEFNE